MRKREMALQDYTNKASMFRWPLLIALIAVPLVCGWAGALFGATTITLGTVVEQLILGLILGSVYALIALGYTLVYGVIKLINFAHGDIYMLGAFFGFYLLRFMIRWLHFTHGVSLIWCWIISVIISAAVCALIAVVMERLAYRPLRGSSRIAALITAVGVSFLLENAGIIVFGANPKSYEPKTLAVYQVELAAEQSFAAARHLEFVETTQRELPVRWFTDTQYARVRLVAKDGSSDWSPVLEITPDESHGYVESPSSGEQTGLTPPASLGYSRKQVGGRQEFSLSWANAAVDNVRMRPVFSNDQGEQLAVYLPLKTAQGHNVRVPVFNIVIVAVTLILLWALNQLINRSMFGMSMRALSFDGDAARLMGINTDKVIAQTFAIGGACAAVAGNMVGIYNQAIEPLMGILPGIKAFVAAVVGGIGSIPGAAVGGMIMGISEALVKSNIPSDWSSMADALAFAILIAVLLFKPSGIFGSAVKEKV
ncbi:branched-chain amino acid ABC transporter permease [bacterium]|nr:branched-chain amino acid ABC transporter permease [bacterium]